MLNMGVAPFNIASSVSLIMAQRLLRRLCSSCKQEVERPSASALKEVGFTDEDLAKDWKLYRAVGCDRCRGQGYKGRAGVYEVMPISEEMQRVIMNNGTEVGILDVAYKEGMVVAPSRYFENYAGHYFIGRGNGKYQRLGLRMKMPSEACLFQTAFDLSGCLPGRRGGQRYAPSGSDISGKLSVW